MSFLVSVPLPPQVFLRKKGQWGMINCSSKPTYGQFKIQIVIPQLSRQLSESRPPSPKGITSWKGRILSFFRTRGSGYKTTLD